MKLDKKLILEGISKGRPLCGPSTVHIDITNACNAACITCWDHSPLLSEGRPASWKKRRLSLANFSEIVAQLTEMGSVKSLIVSGMGDPLANPEVYEMIAVAKRAGYHLTLLSNLLAADIEKLAQSGVDQILVGVHGATPTTYTAFHPGWTEEHFSTLCQYLRILSKAGVTCRHVQVINRDNASDLVAMTRFGKRFAAERVNYKLASLYGGTEACSITPKQRDWLLSDAIPQARESASKLGVRTNLDLFEAQVQATLGHARATTPIESVGCFMGYIYTRITVDREVLYCCNTNVRVGSLTTESFAGLWYGERWQGLRDGFRAGQYKEGCDKCGKFEQNLKWSERYRDHAGASAWSLATGQGLGPPVPRTKSLAIIGQDIIGQHNVGQHNE